MADTLPAPASRNDPCPCGSGQRYKHCHGSLAAAAPPAPVRAHALREAALTAHEAGRLDEAERGYRAALAIDPDDADCLHLLGVLCLRRLAFDEARRCLHAACRLTGWGEADFRRNYAIALTAELGARPPADLAARRAAVDAQRRAQSTLAPTRLAILLIGTGRDGATDDPTGGGAVSSTEVQPVPLGGDADAATVLARLDDALARSAGDWVLLLAPGDRLDPAWQSTCDEAAAVGADWAIAAPAAADPPDDPAGASLAANRHTALTRAVRAGPSLLAEPVGTLALHNLLFKREFLRQRLAATPPSLLALLMDALWHAEPALLGGRVARGHGTATAAAWFDLARHDQSAYVARALSDAVPPNPLAPSVHVDGLRFLREPARQGLGLRVDGAVLRAAADRIESIRATPPSERLRDDGIELIGYARAENGLGQSLRLYAEAALAAGVPIAISDVPLPVGHGLAQADTSLDHHHVVRPTQRIRMVCTNPDRLGEAALIDGGAQLAHCTTIGSWYWELENLPAPWAHHLRLYDTFWAATRFIAAALRRATDRPVHVLMPPVPVPTVVPGARRDTWGLPDDAYAFLYSLDYGAYPTRKHPEAAVRAFRRAFPRGDERAVLVLKCHCAHMFADAHRRLLAESGGDARIRIIDRTLTRSEMSTLQALADAYLSLHRSEGLGLGLAECMALGKPVIATRWSGNLEFMDDRNSLLVDCDLVDVGPGEYPYGDGQRWAEASIEHAAVLIRRLYDDRDAARALGDTARRDMLERHSPAAVGRKMAALLQELRARCAPP